MSAGRFLCQKDVRPKIEHSEFVKNWIESLDLVCASETKISMIPFAFFAGWIVTLLIVPRFSDLYGRVDFIKYGSLVELLAFTVLLLPSIYGILIAAMTVLGLVSTIRVQISIVYLSEHLKKSNWNKVFSATSVFEASLGLTAAL